MRNFIEKPLRKNERISKDDLYEMYITQNLTALEISKIIERSEVAVGKSLQKYDIHKSAEQKSKNISNSLKLREKDKKQNTIEKRKQTCLKKYGVSHTSKLKSTQDKISQTCLDRYGSKSWLGSKDSKALSKKKSLELFGTEHFSQSEETKRRVKETNIKKFGNNYGQNLYLRALKTVQDKYGKIYTSTLQLPQVRKKIEANFIQSGRTGFNQNYSDKTFEIISNKNNLQEFIKNSTVKTVVNLSQDLGVTPKTLYKYIYKYDLYDEIDKFSSRYEIEIQNILSSSNLSFCKDRKVIFPLEIDLFNPDLNLGIEFNGTYYHSELFIDKKYHLNKTLAAQNKNIFIYHIFEYEWNDPTKKEIIISQLNNLCHINTTKIFARNCSIQNVSAKDSKKFLNLNHLQGQDTSSLRLGLYYKNELVSLMTFCKPRFNSKYSFELSRFCSKLNCSIVGGASKLFKHFLKENNGTIVSYSNLSRTTGKIYERLGFKFSHLSPPNYIWWNTRNGTVKSRYQCQMKNEVQVMHGQGYIRIFDCGNAVWVLNKQK